MKRKHVVLLERFSAQFLPEQIETWEGMIAAWEQDQDQPNPFAEPDVGESVFPVLFKLALIITLALTMAQLRLELAEEELAEISAGSSPLHGVSLNVFLQLGLDLEEQQCVWSFTVYCND